jgi:hypothetical protein
MSDSGDGWTVVGKDGKFRQEATSRTGGDGNTQDSCCDAQGVTSTVTGCLQHVAKLQKLLEDSKFYHSLRTAISQSGALLTKDPVTVQAFRLH